MTVLCWLGFPSGSVIKNPPANARLTGDTGSIPGGSPGEGNENPLQYSCLENPMDRGAWWATVHRVAQSPTRTLCWLLYPNYLSIFSFYFSDEETEAKRQKVTSVEVIWSPRDQYT